MGFQRTLPLVLLVLLNASFAATRPIAFSTAHTHPSPMNQPACISAGDFNKDGKADLVVANTFDSVAVMIGKGNGAFQAPVIYTLSFYVTGCIAVGDFDGDGNLDFAVVGGDTAGNGLALFSGRGDGTFVGPTYSLTELSGASIFPVAGRFNHDHALDLFVGGNGSSTLLLGSGTGSFSFGTQVNAAGFGVAAGDFNGDGKLDVASTYPFGGTPGVNVLLGNGDGTFQPPVVYSSGFLMPVGITVGDFNNDHKLDLGVAYQNSAIGVMLGNGDGTFANAIFGWGGNQSGSVVAADFNHDGKLDLAASDFAGDGVTVLQGNGDGSFPPGSDLPTGVNPAHLVVADFNHDGAPDLAVTNFGNNTVSVLLNAAGTTVRLLSSRNPSNAGQTVKFSVAIRGSLASALVPTGSVAFKDGAVVLGKVPLQKGNATFSTTTLGTGSHHITTVYSGSTVFNPNTSAVLVQTVQ